MFSDERSLSPRRDRLKQLRAFCHAARFRSITVAAERTFSSQPAVSQLVRRLEDELSVALFERGGARLALTPAGTRLYQLASSLVEGLDRLPDTFTERYHGVVAGEFNVAAGQTIATTVLPDYLEAFRQRHPEVRVNVRAADGRQRLRWLRDYEVDVILAAVDVIPRDLEFRPIFSSESMFITPEDHPLAGRETVEIAEFAAYPSVMQPSSHYAGRLVNVILDQHSLLANTILELEGWEVIKHYVEAGVGISVVPDICLADHDRLWCCSASRYFPSRRYGVLTRGDSLRSLAAEWFVRIVEERKPRSL